MENNQRNSRKRLNSLILLVAFTAIMLIVSTYAWFSAQRNVTASGLEGKVEVAEGLMISLDAKNWTQAIDFTAPLLDSGATLAAPYAAADEDDETYDYTAGQNNLPAEMIPVSGNGDEDLNTNTEMSFYNGVVASYNKDVDGAGTGTALDAYTEMYDITKSKAHTSLSTNGASDLDYAGFYAIDLFLQNSSKIDTTAGESQGTSEETLQLNTNSLLKLLNAGSTSDYTTGLQNTTRVALAMYNTTGLTNSASTVGTDASSIYVTANQQQILQAYKGAKISDIAIWEPNASTHTEYVQQNNNFLVLDTTVDGLYIAATATGNAGGRQISKFTTTEVIPTYALTSGSLDAEQTLNKKVNNVAETGIADIYDWKTVTGTGMDRQIALQTDTESDYSITGVRNLVSITSPGANIYELGNEGDVVTFDMLQNSIIKLRMYLWLEGQDPDTINQASHGGGVHLDLGLVKGATPGQEAS